MKNGKCPKCGSATVYSIANGVMPGGRPRQYIGFGGIYSAVDCLTYLCATCGYYENYITDQKKLADVVQKWPHVPPQ
jgi:hypothetical protein